MAFRFQSTTNENQVFVVNNFFSSTAARTEFIKWERITKNHYQKILGGQIQNNENIQEYINNTSYEDKIKKLQINISDTENSEITNGTIEVYGRRRF